MHFVSRERSHHLQSINYETQILGNGRTERGIDDRMELDGWSSVARSVFSKMERLNQIFKTFEKSAVPIVSLEAHI